MKGMNPAQRKKIEAREAAVKERIEEYRGLITEAEAIALVNKEYGCSAVSRNDVATNDDLAQIALDRLLNTVSLPFGVTISLDDIQDFARTSKMPSIPLKIEHPPSEATPDTDVNLNDVYSALNMILPPTQQNN